MGWTPERKETLKSMWQSGRTSREIAEHLGEVTRNAVMGMVDRMGLMGDQGHNSRMRKPTYGACRPKGVASTATVGTVEAVALLAQPTMESAVPKAHDTSTVVCEPIVLETFAEVALEESVSEPMVVEALKVPTADMDHGPSEVIAAQVESVIEAEPVVGLETVAEAKAVEDPSEDPADTPPWDVDEPVAGTADSIVAQHANDELREIPAKGRRRNAEPSAVDPRILRGPLVGMRPLPARSAPAKRESAAIRVPTDGSHPADWRLALTLVEEVTGRPYDPSIPGHKSSLVAIGTVLSRGDPRRVLMPYLSEPQIIASMRMLAEKGIVVGGKTPQSWLDPEHGDVSFAIDMLIAEGVIDPKKRDMGMKAAA